MRIFYEKYNQTFKFHCNSIYIYISCIFIFYIFDELLLHIYPRICIHI